MTDMSQSMVYVIDDDAPIRRALARLLRTVGLAVEGFELPREFLAFARPDVPSCLVLDVRLPGSSGLEFQRELQAARIDIPIIFITGHGDIPMAVEAMQHGAFDFLQKPFRDQDLLDAIQLAITKDEERRRGERDIQELRQRLSLLTARERQVMAILITGQLNKQIGAAIGTTESTVKAHRTQIMRKMQANSLPELVRMADKVQLELT